MAWNRRGCAALVAGCLALGGCFEEASPGADVPGADVAGADGGADPGNGGPDGGDPGEVDGGGETGSDDPGGPPPTRITSLDTFQPVASPGDLVEFAGLGFDPDPARNAFRFAGGVIARPVSVGPCPYIDHTSLQMATVAIPEGAATGPVDARAEGGEWSDPIELTIRPAAVIALAPGWEAGGFYVPGYGIGQPDPGQNMDSEPWINCAMGAGTGQGNWCWLTDVNWVLAGSGFASLRPYPVSPQPGLDLLLELPGGKTATWRGQAFDDGLAVFATSQWDLFPLRPGDLVTLRVTGYEPDGHHRRTSPPITLPAALWMRPGATRLLRLGDPVPAEPLAMSPGDLLVVRGGAQERVVTAPGLWEGAIAFRCPDDDHGEAPELPQGGEHPRLCSRHFVVPGPGDYVLTDATAGNPRTVRVSAGGVVGGGGGVVGEQVAQEGAHIGFGGARLSIPEGALPLQDGSGRYAVAGQHASQGQLSWDPEASDGGSVFRVSLFPEPPELLKPITIVLPYDATKYAETPTLGVQDPDSGLYWNLGGTVDAAAGTITVELPAGIYAEPDAAAPVPSRTSGRLAAPAATPAPPPGRLNRLLGALVAWGTKSTKGLESDPTRKLQVDYVTDPASPSFASLATAQQVLAVAAATYDNLQGGGWTVPGGSVTLYLRDMGPPTATKGSTTKGVFGQPWVTINSRLAGAALDTTVAHEMGHVFQRQLTTNLITHWLDEMVAQWVAVDTLGGGADIALDILGASDFPATSLPSTFQFGYDSDQGYAAGALAVWLESQSGGCLLKVYQALKWDPTNWLDARGVLKSECGQDPAVLAYEFGTDYWTQAFDPVKGLGISPGPRQWKDWEGVEFAVGLPEYASTRLDVAFDKAFKPSLAGRDFVVRVTGLAPAFVRVYGDTDPASGPVGLLSDLARIPAGGGWALLGDVSSQTSLRAVVLHAAAGSQTTGKVRFVAPHVSGLSPAEGKGSGGYTVTVQGTGFGATAGKVYVAGFVQQVLSWGDTGVSFRMFNAGTAQGDWDVRIETVEGASTNTSPFRFVP